MIRLAVAASVLLGVYGAWLLWRRPPRRLARADLGGVGIREPAIVQFTTRACGPCMAAVPYLEAAADRTGVAFRQIDVGDRPDVARRFGIRTVPTIALTGRGGRVLRVWTEVPDQGELTDTAGGGPGRASA
jgi:thiol-disulfide isomerase/thioredoxin